MTPAGQQSSNTGGTVSNSPGQGDGETGLARLEARMKDLKALAAAIRSGSPHPEDRRFGDPGSPASTINRADSLLNPHWHGGSNELMAIATVDEACDILDARAAASDSDRDLKHAAAARAIRDALWEEYQPRDVTGTLIRPGDEVEVTRPDGTVQPLAGIAEARCLPPGAMRITNHPTPSAHPAGLYPNLKGDLSAGHRSSAAPGRAARAVQYGPYLPFGKTAATATPSEVDAAEETAARHTALRQSQQARERSAPKRRISGAREQYERETGGTPDPHVPPVLAKNGAPSDDGTIPAIDHKGREYQIRFRDDTVTVTIQGRSQTAPAGTSPTRTARELAGTLSGDYTPATGPYAYIASRIRGIAEELYALNPGQGSYKVDYSGAAPVLLDAARLFDNEQATEGRTGLAKAARELAAWQSDHYFRDHIGDRSRLTAGQARRYADTVTALRRNAGTPGQGSQRRARR